jgi:ORF6N domain
MNKSASLVPEGIAQRIHLVRGYKVTLDADLASLYNVETRVLVQAVKRNSQRFPADFMFQLTDEEWVVLRSQFVTSKGRGGRRYALYVFTEHGALMLSSVLNSETAAEVGILVVRTFVQLREMLSTHKELAAKLEALERKIGSHDQAIAGLIDAIRQLMAPTEQRKRSIGFIASDAGSRKAKK